MATNQTSSRKCANLVSPFGVNKGGGWIAYLGRCPRLWNLTPLVSAGRRTVDARADVADHPRMAKQFHGWLHRAQPRRGKIPQRRAKPWFGMATNQTSSRKCAN